MGEGEDVGEEGGVRPAPLPRLRVERAVERAAVELVPPRRPVDRVVVEERVPAAAAGSIPTGAAGTGVAGTGVAGAGGGSDWGGSERAVSAGGGVAGAGAAAGRRPAAPPLRAREALLEERGVRLTMARGVMSKGGEKEGRAAGPQRQG